MFNVNLSQFLSEPVSPRLEAMITQTIMFEADEAYRMRLIPCKLERVTFSFGEYDDTLFIGLHPEELQDYINTY